MRSALSRIIVLTLLVGGCFFVVELSINKILESIYPPVGELNPSCTFDQSRPLGERFYFPK